MMNAHGFPSDGDGGRHAGSDARGFPNDGAFGLHAAGDARDQPAGRFFSNWLLSNAGQPSSTVDHRVPRSTIPWPKTT